MKLKRNENGDGRGKYAVVKLDKVREIDAGDVNIALDVLEQAGVLTYGVPGADDEFFVIMLKDRFARHALLSYAIDRLASEGSGILGRGTRDVPARRPPSPQVQDDGE